MARDRHNFDTTKEFLQDLLKKIDACDIQLPDFQREWIWDDDRIRMLLCFFPYWRVHAVRDGRR